MAKKVYKKKEVYKFKKGFNYHCSECDKDFRFASLKEKSGEVNNWLVCPECGNIVSDNKRQ